MFCLMLGISYSKDICVFLSNKYICKLLYLSLGYTRLECSHEVFSMKHCSEIWLSFGKTILNDTLYNAWWRITVKWYYKMIHCTIHRGVLPSDGSARWYIVPYTVVYYHQMVLQDCTLYNVLSRITVRWYCKMIQLLHCTMQDGVLPLDGTARLRRSRRLGCFGCGHSGWTGRCLLYRYFPSYSSQSISSCLFVVHGVRPLRGEIRARRHIALELQ